MRRRSSLRIKNNMGMVVLALWLILTGGTIFVPQLRGLSEFFPLIALTAGVLILFDR